MDTALLLINSLTPSALCLLPSCPASHVMSLLGLLIHSALLVLMRRSLGVGQLVIYSHWQQRWWWESRHVRNKDCRAFLPEVNAGQVVEPIVFHLCRGAMKISFPSLWEALYPNATFQERNLFHWLQGQTLATPEWECISRWEALFLGTSHWSPAELCIRAPTMQDTHNNYLTPKLGSQGRNYGKR